MFERKRDPAGPLRVSASHKLGPITSKEGSLGVDNEWVQFMPAKIIGGLTAMLGNIGRDKSQIAIHMSELTQIDIKRKRISISASGEHFVFVKCSRSQIVFDRIIYNLPVDRVIRQTDTSVLLHPMASV